MIAESSVLSTSPWNSEQFMFKEVNQLELFENFSIEDEEETVADTTTQSCMVDYDSIGNSSHTASAASSDCGDDFLVEVCSTDVNLINWVNDSELETSISDMLESSLAEELPFSIPVLSIPEEFPPVLFEPSTDVNPVRDIPNANVRKHNKTVDPFTIRCWSELSTPEQVRAVEMLSQIVSSKLGLREQLDVIRIIDPSAVISTSDTEFVIDLNCLDNAKWQAVRDYVKRATNQNKTKAHTMTTTTTTTSNNLGHSSTKKTVGGRRPAATDVNRNCPGELKRKYSKKGTREEKIEAKAMKQRQKKEQKQIMKERRSGLFAREEVLALSTSPLEEDIDILE